MPEKTPTPNENDSDKLAELSDQELTQRIKDLRTKVDAHLEEAARRSAKGPSHPGGPRK